MKRRKFLQKTLKGVAYPLLVPSLIGCNESTELSSNKTIIVIGAGIAGLAAAQKLTENGYKVTVLEAQEKVGGRLRTNRHLGFAFDEGASWIHGIDKNPITTLAQQAGMKTFFTDDESIKSYDLGGRPRAQEIYTSAEDELYQILDSLMQKGAANQSFETVFKRLYPAKFSDRLWRFLLSTYVTFDTGDLDKLSSLLYNEGEEFGGVEKIVTNGYDTLATYMAQGLSVRLQERVTKIDYSGPLVRVTHNSSISEAHYVLITVPLGVLKKNVIEFVPALPSQKQEAIQKIGMNCVNKFLLAWDKAFWDDVQYISYTPQEADKFNYFVNIKKYDSSLNALMTFAYAEYGRKTENMSDAQITDAIMTHLKDMYGNNIPTQLYMLRTQWNSNPNTYGSYSYTSTETELRHFAELGESINNKLFFAGEHTEIDYFSTVHGAYLSGIREADKILDL